MTPNHRAVMQAALAALDEAPPIPHSMFSYMRRDAMKALRDAIAEPERDTEAAVRRIMEAADEYASAVADIPIPPTPLERALGKDKIERARAELERVVRETLR